MHPEAKVQLLSNNTKQILVKCQIEPLRDNNDSENLIKKHNKVKSNK